MSPTSTCSIEIDRDSATQTEREFLAGFDAWGERASYFSVQSFDPLTLSYGLADSPIGLAAWLVDKYGAWTDREVDLDQALTQVSLYWHTNTIRSSFRLYSESFGQWDATDTEWDEADFSQGDWATADPLDVPTGFAIFPADIAVPPREVAERFFRVERYTLMPSGGHFGAIEEPELLATEIVEFLATVD